MRFFVSICLTGHLLSRGIRHAFILVAFFVFCHQSVAADSYRPPIDEDLQGIYQQIATEPEKALQSLDSKLTDGTDSPARQAQLYWLKAEAEDFLTLSEQARKSVKRAMQAVDKSRQAWLYHRLLLTRASVLEALGEPQQALAVANEALRWAENRSDWRFVNNALVMRGQIYNSLLDYVSAMRDFQRAYAITKQPGHEDMAPGEIAAFIALVYEYRHEPELAIPYFQEYADYFRQQGNDMELSIALYGLGKAYANIGNTELAINLLDESIEKAKKVGDEQGIAYALVELGHIAMKQKNLDQAMAYYRQSREIFEKSGNPYKLYDVSSSMARVAMKQGRLDAAGQWLQRAENYLQKVDSPTQKNNLQFLRAELLYLRGQPGEAYLLLKKAAQQRQKFITEKSTRQLHHLQVQFELQNKQRENELLQEKSRVAAQRNRVKNISLAFSLLLGGILLAWGVRSRQQRRHMEYLAVTDSLTGLPNRRRIMEIARAHKAKAASQPAALALIDFDDFKDINDEHGHAAGDDVLREFGRIARQALKAVGKPGCLGRVGGEEFLLVLPDMTLEDARDFLQKLAAEVSEIPELLKAQNLRVSLSIGLSLMTPEGEIEADYGRVDRALYRAKHLGKNRVEVVEPNEPPDDGEQPDGASAQAPA